MLSEIACGVENVASALSADWNSMRERPEGKRV
jgi:hypothetical protein